MENLLLFVILLKGVCLFFCWKAVVMARNQNSKKINELPDLEKRLEALIEQNKILTETLNEIKEVK